MRADMDTLRQSLPSLMKGFVLTADPSLTWPMAGNVYQYTRMDTVRGQLGGQVFDTPQKEFPFSTVWATSSGFMNDSEEFVRGRVVIDAEISALPADRVRRSMRLALKDADPLEVYCACFSAVDDDLSQWRGYGDNGSGVCLAFDLGKLMGELDGVGYWVVYGKEGSDGVQRSVARGLVQYLHSAISALLPPAPVPDAMFKEIREQLTEIWPTLFLAFKHSDFAAEKEFRIVYSEAVGRAISPSFRPAPLVPFVKLRMQTANKQIPITSIRLGPAISSKLNCRSLEFALKKSSVSGVTVETSGIPYVPK